MSPCRVRLVAGFACLAVGLAAGGALAAKPPKPKPGAFDKSFGNGGKATTGFGDQAVGVGAGAVDSKGRVIVAGSVTPPSSLDSQAAVVRFTAAGKIDKSFSGNGKTTLAITDPVPGYTFDSAVANAVAVDKRDRVVVCGTARVDSPRDSDFFVARFLANGRLDTSFGDSGVQTTGFASDDDECHDLAIDDQGRIVAVGSSDGQCEIARYTPEGQLDNSFDGDGKEVEPLGGGPNVHCVSVAIDDSGRIVMAGEGDDGSGAQAGAIARVNDSGGLDHTFGGTGFLIVPLGEDGGFFTGVAVDSQGRYVMSGTAFGPGVTSVAARVRPDGTLDSSFSQDGVARSKFGVGASLLLDGRDVVLLAYDPISDHPRFRLTRLTAGGNVDKAFSRKPETFGGKDPSAGFALSNASHHRYVVAGIAEIANRTDFAAARFLGK